MWNDLLTSLRAIAATAIVCGVFYPLALLAFAKIAAPAARMGSLVYDEAGEPVGSMLIAQSFTQPGYFWPRPSAVDYNAAAAGGSNLSPLNPQVRERAVTIMERMNLPANVELPAELVTTSGAGLDPHITERGALVQVPRVARARDTTENELRTMIGAIARQHPAGVPGGERLVNVLLLNRELNREFPSTTPAIVAAATTP